MIGVLVLAGCSIGLQEATGPDEPTSPETSTSASCEGPPAPRPRLLRRLTHDQYDASAATLLGTDATPGEGFASDDVQGWFDNHADALRVSSLLVDQYRAAAEELAFDAPIQDMHSCDPDEIGAAECALVFIDEIGLEAFRRPLSETDLLRYHQLWEDIASEDGFTEGLRWVLAAMLQSPHFLYRMELGVPEGSGSYRLTGWEIASELSYSLWGAPPDLELLSAAAADALRTPDQIAEQVSRMAADPRVADLSGRFVEDWLFLDQLEHVTRDDATYPGFTEALKQDMLGETRRLVADLARSGGTLGDLFLADYSFQTPELAAWYGHESPSAPADDDGFHRIELDGVTQGGLLTHGSLLATHALPDSSSPVHRGVLVRERLFCQDLPPPPSNQDVSAPEVDPSSSTRERYEQHTSDPACSGCHDLIDSIGFGFEAYDGVGRWRADENGHAIDDSGAITSTVHTNGEFVGLFELADLLAGSPDISQCAVEMWLTWSTGQEDQTCAAETLLEGAGPTEFGLIESLLRMSELESFTWRTGGGDELATLADGLQVDLDLVPIETDGDYDDPVPDPMETELDWSIEESATWGEGYCSDGTVTNIGEQQLNWEIRTSVRGSLDQVWNAKAQEVEGEILFVGESWNETLSPGETTTFGFCASI